MEKKDMRFISRLIPKGGICIDVGANVGFYALHFAKLVEKNGIVHAFEPDPNNLKLLRENCRLNNFTGIIQIYNLALSDKDGFMPFYQSDSTHSGWGSLYEFKDIVVSHINVPTTTMDNFLQLQRMNKVDFLKVDVEATEFELLAGMKNGLKNQVFRYIFIEFNGLRLEERGKNFTEFLKIFTTNNYKPTGINLEYLEQLKDGFLPQNNLMANFLFEAESLTKA
jgi:FkbM family methyltransferase